MTVVLSEFALPAAASQAARPLEWRLQDVGSPQFQLEVKPTIRQQPNSPFGAVMATSFTLTTIGYAGAAWSVGLAALCAF